YIDRAHMQVNRCPFCILRYSIVHHEQVAVFG
ncbi:MAG: hypothetical protein ACI8R9_002644, partial [Paraglaciecola sp.]